MPAKPIIVTGAAGLIGFSLAEQLSQLGRPVIGLDRMAPAQAPSFPWRQAEIGDVHRLYGVLADADADAIVHCGAVSGPMLGRDNPRALAEVNIGGTLDVLEAARVMRLRRVVYCSSCMAYGHTPLGLDPVDEQAPLAATDIYGGSKAAGDIMLRAYAAQHGLDAVALRFCWVYGPRRTTDCIIRSMLADTIAGRPTRIAFGSGYHRQFVHIDDVVAALLRALDVRELPRRAYNITGGERVTFNQVAGVVRGLLPLSRVELGPGPDPDDYFQQRFDIGAAARDLDWRPQVSLEQGIAAYGKWLEERARPRAA